MNHASDEFRHAAARLDDAASPPSAPAARDPSGAAIDEGLIWEALSTVIDPEIGLDLVTLGLVYDVKLIENTARVTFSLTTPGCPMEEVITGGIVSAVSAVPGVEHVLPTLVWEPRWHPGMIQEGAW